MTDLSNLDEAMKAVESIAIQTSQGSFVHTDDLRKLLEERAKGNLAEALSTPPIRTMNQAKAAAKRDPELQKQFPAKQPDLGRAIQASPNTSSRT